MRFAGIILGSIVWLAVGQAQTVAGASVGAAVELAAAGLPAHDSGTIAVKHAQPRGHCPAVLIAAPAQRPVREGVAAARAAAPSVFHSVTPRAAWARPPPDIFSL
ncbi:MAG: hypothetical protein R2762_00990 [Bryobacteraceae bacterium]